MAKKRYIETRVLAPQGFNRLRRTESRIIELDPSDPASTGLEETQEGVRDWAPIQKEGES